MEEGFRAALDDFCTPEKVEAIVRAEAKRVTEQIIKERVRVYFTLFTGYEKIEHAVKRILETEGARGKWQPIETAPKDGQRILLFNSSWTRSIVIGCWAQKEEHRDEEWHIGEYEILDGCPTYWMPLPDAPEEG